MPFEPIKRNAISEDVTLRIMEMIRTRELTPGEKLPAERQLAEAFGVSRVSLREGLRTLAFMNILDVRTGDGTYVSSMHTHDLVEPLAFILELGDTTIAELTQARQLIEPYLAYRAAKLITDEEIGLLENCMQAMEAAGDDYELINLHDAELHRLIAHAGRNTFLSRFIASLSAVVVRSRVKIAQIEEMRAQTKQEHREIVKAIAARDPEAARRAMAEHLEKVALSAPSKID